MRGVIASASVITTSGDTAHFGNPLTAEQVRYYTLYWDRIIIPANNLIYQVIPDEEILIETGVIERPTITLGLRESYYGSAQIGQACLEAQAQAARRLIQNDRNTDWVLHQFGNDLIVPVSEQEERNSLRFELISQLPVPKKDVPIVEIFEFKARRRDELDNLHAHLDQLYLDILQSSDKEFATSKAKLALEKSVQDLNTVASERWNVTTKYDFSAQINLDGSRMLNGAATGMILDLFSGGITLPMSTIVCGAASVLKISAGVSKSFSAASNSHKLAYLSLASKEQILPKNAI
jgi:hypothetical protein